MTDSTELEKELKLKAAKLVGAEVGPEDTVEVDFGIGYGGYCETCEYTYAEMQVRVITPEGGYGREYTKNISYIDLIRSLTDTEL